MNQMGDAIHVESDKWFIPFCGMYWEFSRANIESVVRMIYDITSVHPKSLPIMDGKMVFSERQGTIMLSYVLYEEDDGSKHMQGMFSINPDNGYKDLLSAIRCSLQDALDLPLITYEDRAIVENIKGKMKPFNFINLWD